ncbi:hypothetical protein JTB14_016307 [Gonioctena quinquepunctata]|nr:hypothetical protein JTB14_016307 [Gonioctena quinquepunctata]
MININLAKGLSKCFRFVLTNHLKTSVLNTVVYGLSPHRTLLRFVCAIADDEGINFSLAAEVIRSSSYIDDFVCGSSSLEKLATSRTYCFPVKKGVVSSYANVAQHDSTLISDLPPSHLSTNSLSLDSDSSSSLKVLGMHWNKSCTKQTILSDLARMYDPLGF